jgi:hypothetical protein
MSQFYGAFQHHLVKFVVAIVHSIPQHSTFRRSWGKKIGEWAVKDDFPITGYNCYNRLFRCWVVERFCLGLVEMEVFHKQSTALGSLGLGISQCFSLCRWTFPFLTKHAACHVSPTGPKKTTGYWDSPPVMSDSRRTSQALALYNLGPLARITKGRSQSAATAQGATRYYQMILKIAI